jgi:hypothetical protein
MKVRYDAHTDILTVILKEGVVVAETDEGRPGVILDYDGEGSTSARAWSTEPNSSFKRALELKAGVRLRAPCSRSFFAFLRLS